MIIGIGKEIKTDERRVALQPHQAKELVEAGHTVLMEADSGRAAGFTDEMYREQGVTIVEKTRMYAQAEMILKVKCPLPQEVPLLRKGQILFTYLHFDENIAPQKLMEIVNTGVTSIAYEWVEENGGYPLLAPMSELTGILFAARSMELLAKYKGKIAGGYLPQIEQPRALIVGAGHIGANAANVFLMNNFKLDIIDKHPETLDKRILKYMKPWLWERHQKEVNVIPFNMNNPAEILEILSREISNYDIILNCAVRRPDLPKSKLEYLITEKMVETMPKGSVLCDTTACDKDFVETAVSSEKLDEIYFVHEVAHYNCDHIPSYTPQTSTKMLTEATFPYIRLLTAGFEKAVRRSPALFKAVMSYRGKLIHQYSAEKKNLPFTALDNLL